MQRPEPHKKTRSYNTLVLMIFFYGMSLSDSAHRCVGELHSDSGDWKSAAFITIETITLGRWSMFSLVFVECQHRHGWVWVASPEQSNSSLLVAFLTLDFQMSGRGELRIRSLEVEFKRWIVSTNSYVSVHSNQYCGPERRYVCILLESWSSFEFPNHLS